MEQEQDYSPRISLQVCCRSRRSPLKLFKSAVSYCHHPTGDASSFYCVSWPGSARTPTCLHSMTPLRPARWYSCWGPHKKNRKIHEGEDLDFAIIKVLQLTFRHCLYLACKVFKFCQSLLSVCIGFCKVTKSSVGKCEKVCMAGGKENLWKTFSGQNPSN